MLQGKRISCAISASAAEAPTCPFKVPRERFVGPGQRLQLRLHLGFEGEEFGLVAALELLGEGLQGLALPLVGFLAQAWPSSRMRMSSWSCSWRFSCRRWS